MVSTTVLNLPHYMLAYHFAYYAFCYVEIFIMCRHYMLIELAFANPDNLFTTELLQDGLMNTIKQVVQPFSLFH